MHQIKDRRRKRTAEKKKKNDRQTQRERQTQTRRANTETDLQTGTKAIRGEFISLAEVQLRSKLSHHVSLIQPEQYNKH